MSNNKESILNELFNARAEKLAEEKPDATVGKEEKFIDIAQNIVDSGLRARLIDKYLRDEDFLCTECGRLSKKYYFNGCADMLNLVIECGGAVNGNNFR